MTMTGKDDRNGDDTDSNQKQRRRRGIFDIQGFLTSFSSVGKQGRKLKRKGRTNILDGFLFIWILIFIFIFFLGVAIAFVTVKVQAEKNLLPGEEHHHYYGEQSQKHHHRQRRPHTRKGHDDDDESSSGVASKKIRKYSDEQLIEMLQDLNRNVNRNVAGGIQWVNPDVLIPVEGDYEMAQRTLKEEKNQRAGRRGIRKHSNNDDDEEAGHLVQKEFFKVNRKHDHKPMTWEEEYEQLLQKEGDDAFKPKVDYTTLDYKYPPLLSEPPRKGGGYPHLKPLQQIMEEWPQDEDVPHDTITETLLHFNFSNPEELKMAKKFRDAQLPFKLTDVPEVYEASLKWTDEYVATNFDAHFRPSDELIRKNKRFAQDARLSSLQNGRPATGNAQESTNHFFAFFNNKQWDLRTMGLPPYRNSDWTFEQWSKHARYADAVSLKEDQPHFYWQAGVPREERLNSNPDTYTFISLDLPSFSSPTENFIVFHPESQKGIQCRFGERGVTAAIHYDSGKNMIGMVTGAKRYILMPPNQCSKLGIATDRANAIYRHSLLDFGHLNYYKNAPKGYNSNGGISRLEYEWLEKAAGAQTVETVLKSGEVLYIPSFWFHYIVSLQKSAQCNVRSGIDDVGTKEFGTQHTVEVCQDNEEEE